MTGRRVPRLPPRRRDRRNSFSRRKLAGPGRAWLAVIVADRLADPAPAAPDVEFIDDDDAPVPGLAIDSAADEIRGRRRMEGLVGGRSGRGRSGGDDHLAAQALGGPGLRCLRLRHRHHSSPRPIRRARPTRVVCHEHRHRRRSDRDPDAAPTATPAPTPPPNTCRSPSHRRRLRHRVRAPGHRRQVRRTDPDGSVPQRDGVRLYTSRA